MGGVQSQQNLSFILDDYKLIAEEPSLKILEDKNTEQTYALKQQCFANRKQYDYRFKKLTSRDQNHDCENILRLTKLWSKQHSGVCSNLFKIYTIYEFPRVKLIDEIEARNKQKKYFEEVQLFSILQSCMNALTFEARYVNISPHIVFIIPEGVLKLVHMDLMDPHLRSVYNPNYYYSPQKIQQFHSENLQSSPSLQKQSIFCLGMTILHSALLQSPNFCYQISNKRLNKRKLEMLQAEVGNMFSQHFNSILASMLQFNPHNRIDFDSLQNEVNNYFNTEQSMILKSSVKEGGKSNTNSRKLQMSLKRLSSQKKSKQQTNSLAYSKDTFLLKPSGSYRSETNLKLKNQRQIMMQLSCNQNENVPKSHYMLEKTKKSKMKSSEQKENQPHFKSVSDAQKLSINNHLSMAYSKDLLSEYQFVSAQKDRCVFVIQNYQDNSRYEGMMQNQLKNGYGKLVYQDGVYYQGNFKNDCIHGKGTLFYGVSRPAYSGQWSNNKFNGKGVLYNQYPTQFQGTFDYNDFNKIEESWIKFEGHFMNDIKQGVGKIYLSNGETMQGNFSKGLLNGEGTFTKVSGDELKGIWTNNLLTLLF